MKIEEIIEEKNLKLTAARRELLEILIHENKPISFEDVKNKIKMDKATFYRNTLKFEQESIINSFESNDKKKYYELLDTPHAHFICKQCNSIECLKNVKNISIEGYIIEDMIFKGRCRECTQ